MIKRVLFLIAVAVLLLLPAAFSSNAAPLCPDYYDVDWCNFAPEEPPTCYNPTGNTEILHGVVHEILTGIHYGTRIKRPAQ